MRESPDQELFDKCPCCNYRIEHLVRGTNINAPNTLFKCGNCRTELKITVVDQRITHYKAERI